MYGRYLGIDIGSDSIKLALVKRGLREVSLLNTWQLVPDGAGVQGSAGGGTYPRTISRAIEELSLPTTDVCASITSNPLSVRVLSFPFHDTKKVDMVYKFELESVSTFNPEEKFNAYHLVRMPEGGSEAIVCMFEPEDVSEMLSMLEDSGLDPRMLTLPTVAMSSVEGFINADRPFVLVDMGAHRVSYTLFDEHGMRRVRTSPLGASSVSSGIIEGLGVSADKAEIIKRTGLVGENREAVRRTLDPLLTDISKTVQFFDLELGKKVEHIKLTGGLALMPGIAQYISERTGLPVSTVSVPELGIKTPVFLQAYALALYGANSGDGSLNLRKDQFGYSGADTELKKTIKAPAVLLLVLMLVSFYGSCSRYFDLKDKVDTLESRAMTEVKELFPEVPVIIRPIEYLQSEVNKLREKEQIFASMVGGARPLDILKDLSQSIPSSINVTIDELTMLDDTSARIQGKVDTYDDVARIQKALEDSGKFREVRQDTTGSALQGKIQFRLTVEI